MTPSRQPKLGFIMLGAGGGWGDWRHPDANPRGSTDIDLYERQTALAEAGKFDFLFVADSVHINERSSPHYLNRFEPPTILSALGAVAGRIGLDMPVSRFAAARAVSHEAALTAEGAEAQA